MTRKIVHATSSVTEYGSMSEVTVPIPVPFANLTVADTTLLVAQPFDPSSISAIEKAIQASSLGLTPSNDGNVVRLPIPQLTEERRKDMIRVVRNEAENGRIAVRNIRRDAIGDVKDLLKEKMIGEDEEHRGEDEIQVITDKYIAEIDQVLADKEAELLEV